MIIPECNYNPLVKFSNGEYISLNGKYYIALTCSLNIYPFVKYITPEYCNFSSSSSSYIIGCPCNSAELFTRPVCDVWTLFLWCRFLNSGFSVKVIDILTILTVCGLGHTEYRAIRQNCVILYILCCIIDVLSVAVCS